MNSGPDMNSVKRSKQTHLIQMVTGSCVLCDLTHSQKCSKLLCKTKRGINRARKVFKK